MKLYKKIILAVITTFAVSNVAMAAEFTVNGTAYMLGTTDNTTTPDGSTMGNYTNQGILTVEGMPEDFPSEVFGTCNGVNLTSSAWTNLGDAFICTMVDADGDGYINVGTTTAHDWSNCSFNRVAAWGKWAGTTEAGACWFAGSVTADHFILKFTSTFTTPE